MVNSKALSSVPSHKYRNLVKVSMGAGTWTELTRSTTSLVTSVKISRKWWWWWYLLITSTKAYCNNQVQKNEKHHHPGRRTVFGQNEPKDSETWDENYNAGQARLVKRILYVETEMTFKMTLNGVSPQAAQAPALRWSSCMVSVKAKI